MIDILKPLIQQFMPFAQQEMGFSRPPKLFLRQDEENAANPLGKTGFYDPQAESITLYTVGRHPKDVMRSLAHELMHHTQKCNGDFDNMENMGEEGYAQNNPHMRSMEIQAYQASIVFRDWEDSTKGTIYYEHLQKGDNVSMSTKIWKNGELKSLLSEAWGFKSDLSKLNEGAKPDYIDLDGDGDKNEPMKKAAKDKKVQEEADKNTGESGVGRDDDDDTYMGHIKEESGDEEGRHYDDDRMSDNDHIKAIEHHLDALRRDRDYDDDHEALEEDGAKRKGDPRLRRPDADRLRESVAKLRKAGFSKTQIKEFLSAAYSQTLKG